MEQMNSLFVKVKKKLDDLVRLGPRSLGHADLRKYARGILLGVTAYERLSQIPKTLEVTMRFLKEDY